MSTAFDLSSRIDAAPDDHARFQLLAEAIRALAEQGPRPDDIARGADVRESELRLQKEIEIVRKEMRESELRLQEQIREVELRLQGQIREVELRLQKEIDQVRVDLKATEVNLRTAMHRQTVWIIGAIGAVTGLIRLLDWLLA